MPIREPGRFGSISVPITLALLLSVMSALLILGHSLLPSWKDQFTFAAAVIGGAAAVYAGYYTAATIWATTERARVTAAFEFLREFNRIGYSKIRTRLRKEIDWTNQSPTEIHAKILGDADLLEVVTNTLSTFEDLAIAIQARYVDEEVLYYSISGTAAWVHDHLIHYIQEEKSKRGDTFYVEFQKLVGAWKNRRSLLTGREFKARSYGGS